MKWRLFVFAVIMTIASTATNGLAGDISLGAKVGMTQTNISQTPASWDDATSYHTGFAGGVFLNYAFGEKFSLQPEMLYVQKGVDATLYDGLISIGAALSIEYFEIPLLAFYTFSNLKKIAPYIYGGPSFSYNLSSNLKVSAYILSADIDFSSFTHTTDFSLIAGGGCKVPTDAVTLLLDFRFMYGLTNVILSGDFEIDGSTQTIDEDDFKNFGFILMAGIEFDI